jgi:hypothetical protein
MRHRYCAVSKNDPLSNARGIRFVGNVREAQPRASVDANEISAETCPGQNCCCGQAVYRGLQFADPTANPEREYCAGGMFEDL